MGLETIQRKENEIRKHISNSYNEYKDFEWKKYTGMRVGETQQWYYDKGEWKEKKIAPDKWEFTYATNKGEHGKLQKVQASRLEQSIIGIFLLIKMSEN
jgi:hypothetical protein